MFLIVSLTFLVITLTVVEAKAKQAEGTYKTGYGKATSEIVCGDELCDDLEKLFEPLFSTKPSGTGLGLASCKNIIESHNGTIIASNNPKKFVITLPLVN